MAAGRSFKEFVKDKCYNGLWHTVTSKLTMNTLSI